MIHRKINTRSELEKIIQEILNKSKRNNVNIIQVGANDGKINDPIHRFLIKNKRKTKAVLVEPQPDIIPFLKKNYKNHPNIIIFNGAVGNEKKLTLFRPKPEFWKYYNEPFFKNVPSYRAPSGIASSDREFVVENIKKKLKYDIPAEEVIEKIEVPCKTIESLAKIHLDNSVDILQIDTEGFDDKIIYSCNLKKIKPSVINYEYQHLGKEKELTLERHLRKYGYEIIKWSNSDKMAVLSSVLDKKILKNLESKGFW